MSDQSSSSEALRMRILACIIVMLVAFAPSSNGRAQDPPSGASASTPPKPTGPRKLRRYRAVIYGLPEFDCVSIDDLGVAIMRANAATDDPLTPPDVKRHSKILDLKLERRFDMDRQFHEWIQAARAGKAEPKDGVVMLLDDSNQPIVRFKFFQALPKKWEINIPPMGEKQKFVTETVTLSVQDMEMEY